MAQQPVPPQRSGGGGLDFSRLTTADKIILGGAGLYFIWSFIPLWYSGPSILGVGSAKANGWSSGVVLFAAILSILAVVWVMVRLAGVNIQMNINPGLVDLALAGLATLFTLLGLVVKPAFGSLFIGIFIGIIIALVWAYGAYMKYQEGGVAAGPPPPPGGGGFSA